MHCVTVMYVLQVLANNSMVRPGRGSRRGQVVIALFWGGVGRYRLVLGYSNSEYGRCDSENGDDTKFRHILLEVFLDQKISGTKNSVLNQRISKHSNTICSHVFYRKQLRRKKSYCPASPFGDPWSLSSTIFMRRVRFYVFLFSTNFSAVRALVGGAQRQGENTSLSNAC